MTPTRATVLRRFNRNRLRKTALMAESHKLNDRIAEVDRKLKADARALGIVDSRWNYRPGWQRGAKK